MDRPKTGPKLFPSPIPYAMKPAREANGRVRARAWRNWQTHWI